MGSSVRAAASKSAAPFMQSNEAAMAGSRCHAACLAAAHVPETKMHRPQLGPLLMPEMTRSGRLAGGGGGGLTTRGREGTMESKCVSNEAHSQIWRRLRIKYASCSLTWVCVCVCVLPPSLRRPFFAAVRFSDGRLSARAYPRVHSPALEQLRARGQFDAVCGRASNHSCGYDASAHTESPRSSGDGREMGGVGSESAYGLGLCVPAAEASLASVSVVTGLYSPP